MLESTPPIPTLGAAESVHASCSLCNDWASRSFGPDGVATGASPLARTRSLTWCPGCGDYIPAPSLGAAAH
jgi:hypothetical protein